jgi:hypothetical protein
MIHVTKTAQGIVNAQHKRMFAFAKGAKSDWVMDGVRPLSAAG